MSKFKVGDKVRYIKNTIFHNDGINIGDIYTISSIKDDGEHYVKENEDYFEKRELELFNFTKAHLKPHHIIEDRNGDKYIWEKEDEWDFNSKLECEAFSRYDIMKVYEFETIIWERESEATEMTVAEIEEVLGRKIKIIKGGE